MKRIKHTEEQMDFVSDQLVNGGRFRSLTIVDVLTKGSPDIEVARSLPGQRVVRAPT